MSGYILVPLHPTSRRPWPPRRRQHRLEKRVRPANPPRANADPWIIADEALDLLDRPHHPLRGLGLPTADLDEIAERMKQLC